MTDFKEGLPKVSAKPKGAFRRYDIFDLFIVSFYNFFTFALGLGLGYLIWGMNPTG